MTTCRRMGRFPQTQTRLDVLVAKDLIEQNCIIIRWLPNANQFADFLTKPEVVTPNRRCPYARASCLWFLFKPKLTTRHIAWSYVAVRGSELMQGRKLEGRASAVYGLGGAM